MSIRSDLPIRIALVAAALSLAGCDRTAGGADRSGDPLAGKGLDPALTSALADPILTDPALTQQSNLLAVRPTARPFQAQYPLSDQAGEADPDIGCVSGFDHGSDWARQVPPAFFYPAAKVTDAAGRNDNDCHARVAVLSTSDAPDRVLGWYRATAVQAGWSAAPQRRGRDLLLFGSKGDASYVLVVSPGQSGSTISLIVGTGR